MTTTHDPAQVHRDTAKQLLTDAGHLDIGDPGRVSFLLEAQVHATLAQTEEMRTANQIAVWDDGMAGKYIGPDVNAANADYRHREQQAIKTAFKHDHRERLRHRTGLV